MRSPPFWSLRSIFGGVKPARGGQRQAVGQIEGVGEEHAVIRVADPHPHRRVAAGLIDDHAGADEHAGDRG